MSEILGVGALLLLLVLPGLAVVRAPWTAVPFLSLSFWIVSWSWCSFLGASRQRFLLATLFFFLALALLRLLKPLPLSRPSWPVLLVLTAALTRLFPYWLWPVAPGADMSLHSLSALLMVWRDGLPSSYEPLLPIHTFGAYTPGLHGLAADISLLSGLPAHRSAFLISLAAYGLLQVALFALLSRLFRPSVAALGAVLALGMARAPQAFLGWGGNTSVLALAFLVAAAELLARTSRASASGAGVLLAAAAVTHTMMAAIAVACFPLLLGRWWRASPEMRPHVVRRLALAALAALLAAAPFLFRLDFTLSGAERAMALLAILLAVGLAFLVEALLARPGLIVRLALLALIGIAGERTHRYYFSAGSNVMVTEADLEAMAWIGTHTQPLDLLCNQERTAGLWIPALAGRAISNPHLPAFYFDEFRAGSRDRRCSYTYVSRRFFFGPPVAMAQEGRVVFHNGDVTVLQTAPASGPVPSNPPR